MVCVSPREGWNEKKFSRGLAPNLKKINFYRITMLLAPIIHCSKRKDVRTQSQT